MTGRLDTVGIDLVAMCADDVVCTGAEPLFFLDYLAVGGVVPERVAAIVEGVAEGCRRAGCALLGGETAEHPGVMPDDQFDLAGFCVGVVDEADLLGPDRVREGDVLIGLRVERAARERLLAGPRGAARPVPARRTRRRGSAGRSRRAAGAVRDLRARRCCALARAGLLHAAAHITGGGFHENMPRALPPGLGARDRPRLVAGAAGVRSWSQAAARRLGRRPVLDVQHGRRDGAGGRSGRCRRGAGRAGPGASRIGARRARRGRAPSPERRRVRIGCLVSA